jgi:hypothetical protein
MKQWGQHSGRLLAGCWDWQNCHGSVFTVLDKHLHRFKNFVPSGKTSKATTKTLELIPLARGAHRSGKRVARFISTANLSNVFRKPYNLR